MVVSPLLAHDMFLRPAQLFVAERAEVLVRLLNGTFSRSENSITRDRLVDVAIVSPTGRATLDTAEWNTTGDTSTFTLKTGSAGTYVIGVSTRPRVLELPGEDFNTYLRDDGIPDELAARRREGRLQERSKERYHKHVKAMLQVGTALSDAYATVLGYPAEIVPLSNPYELRVGDILLVRVLVNGRPVPNQYVQYGGRTRADARFTQRSVRANAEGVAAVAISRPGTYYVKFIHMTRLPNDPEANYESAWATLVFGVK
jgi:uncharacterized GH25 family protein